VTAGTGDYAHAHFSGTATLHPDLQGGTFTLAVHGG
jgi:hypothetical protein